MPFSGIDDAAPGAPAAVLRNFLRGHLFERRRMPSSHRALCVLRGVVPWGQIFKSRWRSTRPKPPSAKSGRGKRRMEASGPFMRGLLITMASWPRTFGKLSKNGKPHSWRSRDRREGPCQRAARPFGSAVFKAARGLHARRVTEGRIRTARARAPSTAAASAPPPRAWPS